MEPIRVVELFSGIGAQNAALKMSGLEYEIVAVCEIDEKAYRAYCALNDECPPNLGDISQVERLPRCDCVTFSAPCTDISNAGQRKGMEEGSGTRTALIYEVARVIENTPERERPMYCLGENVPDIVNRKNKKHFLRFVQRMQNLGYACTWKILNAKNFGVPQNRDRCFMIFSRVGMSDFPQGWQLDRCLADILEENVPEKYYLSQKAIEGLIVHRERHEANGNGFGFRPLTPDDIAHAVTTGEGYHNNSSYVIEIAKTSFDSDNIVDPIGISNTVCCKHVPKIIELIDRCEHIGDLDLGSYEQTNRVYGVNGCSPAVTTSQGGQRQIKILIKNDYSNMVASEERGIIIIDGEFYSIRRLTPRECFRLFGFTEEEIDRVFALEFKGKRISDSALYKIAGNSIVVPVLSEIFRSIFTEKVRQPSLFDF